MTKNGKQLCVSMWASRMKRGSMTAARHVWEECFGQIPDGLNVLHKCDNPVCVNPEHLELGTQSKNIQDCVKRGRYVVNKGQAKICAGIASRIRASNLKGRELARIYGISEQAICDLRKGRTWKR